MVIDSRKREDGIYRRRRCYRCRKTRSTMEVPAARLEHDRMLRLFVDQEIVALEKQTERLRKLRQRVPQEPPC